MTLELRTPEGRAAPHIEGAWEEDQIDTAGITRRVHEIHGFIKGGTQGEAYDGEANDLAHDWEKIGNYNRKSLKAKLKSTGRSA